jgi:hypothetical protein
LYLFISGGVLGVASLEYLPDNNDPPDLDTVASGCDTDATLPEPVDPVDADSLISLNLI